MTHNNFQKFYFPVYGQEMDYFIDANKVRFFSFTKVLGLICTNPAKLDILEYYPSSQMYSDEEEVYISEMDMRFLLTEQTSKMLVSIKFRKEVLEGFKLYGFLEEEPSKVYQLSRQSYINYCLLDDDRSKLKKNYYAEEMYKCNPIDRTHEVMVPDVPVTLSDHLYIIAHDEALRNTAIDTNITINGLTFKITQAEEENEEE